MAMLVGDGSSYLKDFLHCAWLAVPTGVFTTPLQREYSPKLSECFTLMFSSSRFLSSAEKVEVERRLRSDCSSLSEEFDRKYIYQALKDWKIWIMCLLTMGIFTPLYSIALFMPTIIKTLGYSNNAAQLMTVPPYVTACFCTLVGNWCADKAGQRGVFLIGFQLTAITGFILLLCTTVPHIQYAGTFLATAGMHPFPVELQPVPIANQP